jgi:hypothetical protein
LFTPNKPPIVASNNAQLQNVVASSTNQKPTNKYHNTNKLAQPQSQLIKKPQHRQSSQDNASTTNISNIESSNQNTSDPLNVTQQSITQARRSRQQRSNIKQRKSPVNNTSLQNCVKGGNPISGNSNGVSM